MSRMREGLAEPFWAVSFLNKTSLPVCSLPVKAMIKCAAEPLVHGSQVPICHWFIIVTTDCLTEERLSTILSLNVQKTESTKFRR